MFRSALPVFLILSVMLHAAPLVLWMDSGQQAAGGNGKDSVTLEAASASLGALVREWTTPPSVSPAPTPPSQPSVQHLSGNTGQPLPPPASLPQTHLTSRAPKAPALPLPKTAPSGDTAPNIDTSSPARPNKQPDPAPEPRAKPPAVQKQDAPVVSKSKPRNRPKPAAAPSRAQTRKQAKGVGQSAAGSGGAAQETTGTTRRQANLRKQWEAQILARLARQNRHARERGEVRLRFVIHTSGQTRSVSIAKSSKIPALDAKALSLAKRVRPPRAPRKLAAGDYTFVVQFVFDP